MSARSMTRVLISWRPRLSVTRTPRPGPVWPNQSRACPSRYQKTAVDSLPLPEPRSTTQVNFTLLLCLTWTSLFEGLSIRASASEIKKIEIRIDYTVFNFMKSFESEAKQLQPKLSTVWIWGTSLYENPNLFESTLSKIISFWKELCLFYSTNLFSQNFPKACQLVNLGQPRSL